MPVVRPHSRSPARTEGRVRDSGRIPAERRSADVFDWLVIGLVMTYVWRLQDLFPLLAAVQLPILISLAALGVFLAGHTRRAQLAFRDRRVRLATFILIWMVLSVPTSVYTGLSLRFIINDHIKTFLMMLLLIASIRSFRDVERLALAHLVGASLYCVMILTRFSPGAGGRLGDLYYYDSNDLSLLIVSTLPFAVYALGVRGAWKKFLAMAAALIFVVAIVQSGSRGGFLGLIAVGLFLLFGYRSVPARVRLGAVAGVLVLLISFAGPRYWEMMGTLLKPTEDYNWSGQNDVGRMAIWTRGMGYMADRPILGVGVQGFATAEGTLSEISRRQQYGIGFKWSTAHNSFVQIGAELGVPGLVAFILLLASAVRGAWTAGTGRRGPPRGGGRPRAMGQALVGALVGYMVAGFFLSQAYSVFLYSVLGMIVGLRIVGERSARARARMGSRAPGRGIGSHPASRSSLTSGVGA